MSSKTISIKRHNHRIHPCDQTQKADLLNFLIAQNSGTNILVVTANDTEAVKNLLNDASIVVANDSELAKSAELQGDLLISYDLPNSAVSYMLRLSRAKTHAIILLDEYQRSQRKREKIQTFLTNPAPSLELPRSLIFHPTCLTAIMQNFNYYPKKIPRFLLALTNLSHHRVKTKNECEINFRCFSGR